MRSRRDSLTRAELIGGIIATGALAACGGSVTPPPPALPLQCSNASLSSTDPHQIFSDPAFTSLDKDKLSALFDPSSTIEANYGGYFSAAGRQLQTSNTIGTIPSGGIVIQSPGKYSFSRDIQWTPSADFSSAIWIACGDVVLDFAGFTLTASVPDVSWHTAGILVGTAADTPIADITISGGTIANVTEYGIFAKSVCGLQISRITVTGVCMQNLATRLLTPTGIYVTKSLEVSVALCSVTQSTVKTDSCAGIFLHKTIGAGVTGCIVNGFKNLDGAVQGFSCIKCIDVATSGCTAQTLQSFFKENVLASGHTVLGFCPIFCWNLSYTDCTASGMTGSCDDVHGISVFLDGNVTVTRFHADSVVDGPPPYNTGAKATGIEVYGVGVSVTDSTASNITAYNPEDFQATGFSAWGLGIQFERCTATNVVATGIGARGTGFGWAPDPRPLFALPAIGVTYTGCTANTCAVGFDTFYHIDSTWVHPTYVNCGTNLLIEPGVQRLLFCDGCSECPTNGPLNPPGISLFPPGAYAILTNIASGNTVVP